MPRIPASGALAQVDRHFGNRDGVVDAHEMRVASDIDRSVGNSDDRISEAEVAGALAQRVLRENGVDVRVSVDPKFDSFGSATANVHTRTALVPANGSFEQTLGGVFHEAGHIHHQHEYTDDAAATFQQEQQADRFEGHMLARAGVSTAASEALYASLPSDDRHGTPAERIAALREGHAEGSAPRPVLSMTSRSSPPAGRAHDIRAWKDTNMR